MPVIRRVPVPYRIANNRNIYAMENIFSDRRAAAQCPPPECDSSPHRATSSPSSPSESGSSSSTTRFCRSGCASPSNRCWTATSCCSLPLRASHPAGTVVACPSIRCRWDLSVRRTDYRLHPSLGQDSACRAIRSRQRLSARTPPIPPRCSSCRVRAVAPWPPRSWTVCGSREHVRHWQQLKVALQEFNRIFS